jgi:HD-GYP domain-containing protein (c-di-GMP phosphodiesterase class II)
MNVKDIRLKDGGIFSHSVNTAILAALMMKRLGYRYDKLVNIVSGCILHDLGKIFLPQNIAIQSPYKMSKEDYNIYKTHSRLGYEMFLGKVEINPTERVVILMHHENVNGSGFPDGLVKDKINEGARICSVCNSFDNFLNDPARKGIRCTSDAVEFISSMSEMYFDGDLVKEFMKYIPIYPAGTMVLLSNGFVGLVSKNNEVNLLRPIVRVFYDIKSKRDIKPYEVDLMKELTLRIEGEFSSSEVEKKE